MFDQLKQQTILLYGNKWPTVTFFMSEHNIAAVLYCHLLVTMHERESEVLFTRSSKQDIKKEKENFYGSYFG